jgi:hypothetical protein
VPQREYLLISNLKFEIAECQPKALRAIAQGSAAREFSLQLDYYRDTAEEIIHVRHNR